MADFIKTDIASLEGNTAAQPRVFAHSAEKINETRIIGAAPAGHALFDDPSQAGPGDTVSSLKRGACLYIGIACDITVVMENQPNDTVLADAITFKGCTAGSFLPILVTKVFRVTKTDGQDFLSGEVGDGTILALY